MTDENNFLSDFFFPHKSLFEEEEENVAKDTFDNRGKKRKFIYSFYIFIRRKKKQGDRFSFSFL